MKMLPATPKIIQGANGTILLERHPYLSFKGESVDSLNLIAPEAVKRLHEEYIAAGADILITNTFLSSPLYSSDWRERLRSGVSIALAAREKMRKKDGEIEVAVALAPPPSYLSEEEMSEIYNLQLGEIAQLNAETVLFETLTTPSSALAAVKATENHHSMKVWLSFTPLSPDLGEFSEIIPDLEKSGVPDYLGINCVYLPAGIYNLIRELASLSSIPLRVRPAVENPEGKILSALESAKQLSNSIEDICGIESAGYCCGSTPEYIRILKNEIKINNYIYA